MDKNKKLTPKEINTMANAKNVAELLRQQSLDRLAEAAKKALKEAQKGKK